MEPVRRYVGECYGYPVGAFAETGLKIDTVHILVASLSEHRVLVVFVVGTNPSTARGLAIWRRLNHPHNRMALLVTSVVIDGVRLSSVNRAISIG